MTVSGLIFLFVGVLHGIRAGYGWEVIIGGWMVPIWVSWLAAIVLLILALYAIRNLK